MNEFLGLDNLMGMFGLDKSPFFAQYYNSILAKNENQELDIRGARWGDLQPVFTYEMWEVFNEVEAMATFVDLDSDPLPMGGRAKSKKMTGSIPRHKALITLSEADYRQKLTQLYQLQNTAALMGQDPAQAVRFALEEYFYAKLSSLPAAHKNTLNFMLGQLKSRLDFTLNEKNNPQGIKGVTFPSHVPAQNRIVNAFWSKNTTTGVITYNEAKDPAAYFKKMFDGIRNADNAINRYENITVETSRKSFVDMMGHPAWAKHVAYLDSRFYFVAGNDANAIAYGTKVLEDSDDAAKVSLFCRITGANEVLLNKAVVSAEHIQKATNAAPVLVRPIMDAFDYGKFLVRPSGDFIKIIPVVPMRPDASAVTATMFDGRGIIEYWYDKREKIQTWRSEMTCFPVFMAPSRIYSVDVNGSFEVAPKTITLTADGTAQTAAATVAATPVTATSDKSWLKAEVNGTTISVSADESTGKKERNGSVVVTDANGDSATIEVTQQGQA